MCKFTIFVQMVSHVTSGALTEFGEQADNAYHLRALQFTYFDISKCGFAFHKKVEVRALKAYYKIYKIIAEKMEPQKCILITGFGPFRDIKQNISWCAVESLSKVWPDHWPPLVTREIPVAYSEVRRIVPKLWQELQPRLVVHVGVDSQGGMFHLEQCSHNAGYNKCDVNDMICEGESCLANPDRPVEDCIRTQLDLEVSLILIGLCDFLC